MYAGAADRTRLWPWLDYNLRPDQHGRQMREFIIPHVDGVLPAMVFSLCNNNWCTTILVAMPRCNVQGVAGTEEENLSPGANRPEETHRPGETTLPGTATTTKMMTTTMTLRRRRRRRTYSQRTSSGPQWASCSTGPWRRRQMKAPRRSRTTTSHWFSTKPGSD